MVSVLLAGVLMSSVPDAKPDHVFVHAGVNYDVYVQDADSGFEVTVCARYRLTGTRLLRNTCKGPSAQEAASLVPIKQDENTQTSAHLLFKRRAASAQRVANALINTDTTVSAFWKKVAEAIKQG